MSQREIFVRPPLATRQRLNNMAIDAELFTKQRHDLDASLVDGCIQHEEDEGMTRALENASRLYHCSWSGCAATLGSWKILRLHVENIHCETLLDEASGKASLSRPYRCRYASCQNRTFSNPTQLLDHVVWAHLESLKLRCPFGCKHATGKLQALAQHLSSAHGKNITELVAPQIHLPPLRHASLPELATDVQMGLECVPKMMPCATFDPTKAKRKPEAGFWEDFEDLGRATGPFGPLRLPADGLITGSVRLIPRKQMKYEGTQKRSEEPLRIQGATVGYESWKRQFETEPEPAHVLPGAPGQ